MLHNDQSQYVFAQSKHPIMAVIHLYSLTDQPDQVTALLNSNAIRGSRRENFVACCWEYCFVKNSCEFADFIGDKTLNACEELVSFDVVSLFTKIPVDLAVKVAEERLREDASLGQRTSLLFQYDKICSVTCLKFVPSLIHID